MSTPATRLPPDVTEALERFRAALVRELGDRLLELRLFGSYARGEAWEESDVDVLVLVDGLARADVERVTDLAADAGAVSGGYVAISPFVRSPEQLAELKRRELRIADDIEREGIPL